MAKRKVISEVEMIGALKQMEAGEERGGSGAGAGSGRSTRCMRGRRSMAG